MLILPEREKRRPHLELCDTKARLNGMHVVLVRYREGDGSRFNDLHAEAVLILAEPIYDCSTIRVILSEVLKFAMRDIIKLLQSGLGGNEEGERK
jgi:hypothetical protein